MSNNQMENVNPNYDLLAGQLNKANERIKVLEETIAARDRECKSEHYNTLESQDTEIALLRKRIKVMEGEKANEGD
jgi:uncharacterized protein involved in exopolysaccharide biosynthesis